MDARSTYEGQSRFNFYLVALAFSLLGLAIQSFNKSTAGLPLYIELLAWLLLLVSALFALSYVEWSSKAQDLNAVTDKLEQAELQALSTAKEPAVISGQATELLARQHGTAKRLRGQEEALAKALKSQWVREGRKYGIAKWSFLVGICLLATARVLQYFGGAVPELTL